MSMICTVLYVIFSKGVLDTGSTVEVILGAESNSKSVILDGLYGQEISTYNQPRVLGTK